jgi:hypothetical protein
MNVELPAVVLESHSFHQENNIVVALLKPWTIVMVGKASEKFHEPRA